MGEPKPTVLHSIAGGGVAPWPESAEKELRTTLEDLLKDYEQILVVGVRRDPAHPQETQTMYGFNYRPTGRTSMNEFLGSLYKLVHHLERESRGESDE